MTTQEYAQSRGISYWKANRLLKAARAEKGKPMSAGRYPTEVDQDDVARADEWSKGLGPKVARQREFEALKLDWVKTWEGKAYAVLSDSVDASEPIYAVLGLMSAADSPAFFEREWGTGRMGDAVLKVAIKAEVDLDPAGGAVPWPGFTRWLIDQGYAHQK